MKVFGEVYLRDPNAEDTTRLLEFNRNPGFPNMLESPSIYYMHWRWKNCHGTCNG
jgi:hypothetical protein